MKLLSKPILQSPNAPLLLRSASLGCFFIVGNFGAVLQLSANRAVTSRNHFVARLNPALYLHVSVVRDSGGHLDQLRLAPFFQKHDFCQFFALLFLGGFFLTLVHKLGAVVAFIALRDKGDNTAELRSEEHTSELQ